MTTLPITLPNGMVAIYGMGTTVSGTGISPTEADSPIRYGSIYQIWDGGAVFLYGGDNIMFNNNDVHSRVLYGGIPYTIVPARLATKENILP